MEHVEQATAAPGEVRQGVPPFPTIDNIEFTDAELIEIGRGLVEFWRAHPKARLVFDAE